MTQKDHFRMMFNRLTTVKDGVHLNKVLCSTLMYIAGGKRDVLGGIKSLARFILSFDTSELHRKQVKNILIVFGFYPTRKDHQELMEGIANRVGETCTYIDMSKWSTHRLVVSPKNIYRSLKDGFWKMKSVGLSVKERLLLAANISFYLNTIDSISKMNFSNTSKFLCLANSLDLENLLTQFMNKKGIQTYSLMEGAYFVQDNQLPITNIAFENLTSNVQLCWGQYSKDEFIKFGYPPHRLMVAGYPKNVEGKKMKINNTFSKVIVLLSQYFMDPQNQRLIDILSHYTNTMDVYIKLHPSLNFDLYSQFAKEKGMKIIPKEITINQCINNDNFDFAVAINSTAYYEALMRGLPCLRFYDGSYTPLSGYDDEFSDSESFMIQLNKIKGLSPGLYQNYINKILEYSVGWGINNYKQILS